MIELARDGYTSQQIKDALHARTGSRNVEFRIDVIRSGAAIDSLPGEGSIALNTSESIQRTGRFIVYKELDWLRDELRPMMRLNMPDDLLTTSDLQIMPVLVFDSLNFIVGDFDRRNITVDEFDSGVLSGQVRQQNWVDFPLGVFIPSTPSKNFTDGLISWSIDAYDRTVILKEDSLIDPLYFPIGLPYIDAIYSILTNAGIENVIIEQASPAALPTQREFPIGTSKLEVINTLLTEINYNPIYCDEDGNFIISPYTDPDASRVDYEYRADELSILGGNVNMEYDYFNTPNVFIAVCDNPELEGSFRSIWVNDNPASPLSTVSRGRNIVSEIYSLDVVESKEKLDAFIQQIGQEATRRGYEAFYFETAVMPIHGSGNVLSVIHPEAAGIYIETAWSLPLSSDGLMSHITRRAVEI